MLWSVASTGKYIRFSRTLDSLKALLPYSVAAKVSNHFLKYLQQGSFVTGFSDTPALGHPLAIWPRVIEEASFATQQSISSRFLHHWAKTLNPTFIVSLYESVRDAYCIGSVHSAVLWIGCTSFFAYFLAIMFSFSTRSKMCFFLSKAL